MDTLDQNLLGLLRANARLSVATLAKKLDVSRGTIDNRIRKLEERGLILGYTVRLRPDVETEDIVAWMSIAVEGHETRKIVNLLMGEPSVAGLHDTNGRWDLLAELRVPTIDELSEVLDRLRTLKGIAATETSIHLKTFKAL
ncbi:Lrp/AsnC family transcriptional regulator [Achromobacter denitrificans]|jgi:DNA-binding Lrp family transcriptional regulator|uniref:Lrp/AsnC family transcriptional regulator n=1 Tax=Achromobacter denitrificans TaxID=32002 RepID=A0A3R9FJB4_ACHDE|nr:MULTISPECIES: Lrp/AsnC family transcriptional regulator [Achromobacter]ASC64414.1 Lrp/AsnC family transcriptional regulator [Achromobacter denitrificans]MBV2157320.1 Lrp/AsnC family transcriptional regulator [Achromobacter denitrificans]MDF3849052.1 Lrp/AsnC family transcriptional regulator [Achromobacter denitrificans]MDF3860788.1 Lrp/AsnC family transcriptional regulator [Achromobacter denitrificans]MDF3944463.1 Lrp/AsnC family transcriptional regulator [Achromobacter denitrificans]